jgi:RNA polymerase sigma factor (sigma-70 family)
MEATRREGGGTMNDEIYVEGIFNSLLEITENFRFSEIKGEPPEATPAERHRLRLLALITSTRKIAKKKFRQMPADFRAVHAEDDRIQEAMVILISESLKYTPKEGYYYDKYMLSKINWRLTDQQRSIFKENPPIDEDLRKYIASMRRELKREPTPEEISDRTGVSLEHLRRVLYEGVVATRLIVRESAARDLNKWSEEDAGRGDSSPEDALLQKELRQIIMECLSEMRSYDRYVVIKRYFERLSYPDISEIMREVVETTRTHCRRAFGHLRNCVLGRYGIRTPLQ